MPSCEKPLKKTHDPSEKELKMYAQHSVRTDPDRKTDSIGSLHASLPYLQPAGTGYEDYIQMIMNR